MISMNASAHSGAVPPVGPRNIPDTFSISVLVGPPWEGSWAGLPGSRSESTRRCHAWASRSLSNLLPSVMIIRRNSDSASQDSSVAAAWTEAYKASMATHRHLSSDASLTSW